VTDDELFLLTISDLHERLQLKERQMDALNLALPLRKMLVEGSVVANVANPRRVKVRYRVSDESAPTTGDWYPDDALLPGNGAGREVDRQGFLHCTAMVTAGRTITVGGLIKYVANYEGVVHKAEPNTPEMQALWDYNWGACLDAARPILWSYICVASGRPDRLGRFG
jgi:hypothetical protein